MRRLCYKCEKNPQASVFNAFQCPKTTLKTCDKHVRNM